MKKRQQRTAQKVGKVSTTVRLPEDVRRRAKVHAAELGITVEEYVARALRLYHERQEAVA